MADKGPQSTSRSTNKRLARAKLKTSDNGIKSSKGRKVEAADTLSKAEAKKARKKKITAVAVGAFAVIMALSMTLPSLTYIFGNNDQTQQQEQSATSDDSSSDTDDQAETETETKTGMDLVDSNYQAVVVPLEKKLEDNPEDLATLLNLGNDYLSWAASASSYATDEDTQAHVTELFEKAIEYYDKYLELNDSNAVKVNRALAQLYSGDTTAATEALEQLTTDAPDYGPAWSNLGYAYEMQYNQDKAKEAYQKAVEVDADDEYGSKSFANNRLAAMAASSTDLSGEADATDGVSSSTDTGVSALDQALGNTL